MGNDPVRFGFYTDVLANLASAGHLRSGGAGEVHGLDTDLVWLPWAGSNWAHVQ